HIRCSPSKRLHDFGKVAARSNALSVRANHVRRGYAPCHCPGGRTLARRRVRSSGRGTALRACRWAAQEYHDAGSFSRKAEVNMREEDGRIQIVVGNFVAERTAVRAERRRERTARRSGHRRNLAETSKAGGERVDVIALGRQRE